MDVDPLVLGNAQRTREARRSDDHRRRLVHLIARDRHARIGLGDDAVAVGDSGEFLRAALDRRGGVRVSRRDAGEGREQLADFEAVVLQPHAQLVPPCVLGERIERDRPARAVHEQHGFEQFLDPETLILEVAADFFRPVGDIALGGEREDGRDRFGTDDHRTAAVARGDGRGKLAHQLLVGLPAGGGEDRAGRVRPHPLGNRARHIVRRTEGRLAVRPRHFEGADRGEGVDGLRHVTARSAIRNRCPQRPSGKVHVGQGLVTWLSDPFRILPDPDDDGRGVSDHAARLLSRRSRPRARR